MDSGPGRKYSNKEYQLRRLALQIASQLPPDAEDARQVIGLMMELTDTFLSPQQQTMRTFSVLNGGAGKLGNLGD